MSWVSFALAILKVVSSIITWARERELISEGQDSEIAKTTAAILAQTEYAKNVRKEIANMDATAIDAALHDLEPK